MKILWFSNIILSDQSMSGTGTWISAMAESLSSNIEVELFNVTKGNVPIITKKDYGSIKQWIVPIVDFDKSGLPPVLIISKLQELVNEIQPDLIHVWGTEYYWSRLTAYGHVKGKVLLEMQGLIGAIAEKVTADLSIKELMQCIGIKEILKPSSSILGRKKALKKRGEIEKDIIARHHYISTQSDWMRAHISYLNPKAMVFKTAIGLRSEFINASKWIYENCEKNSILTITSTISAYKGLHTLIKAFALLTRTNHEAFLYIAGPKPIKGIKQPGYERFLLDLIRKENIQNKIVWLGPLNTSELITQILKANVVINPSFIESYSLVVKEALSLGAPTIAAYAGAMPELAIDKHSALYFPPGDVALCYTSLNNTLDSRDLTTRLSQNALTGNENIIIAKIQYDIYQKILKN